MKNLIRMLREDARELCKPVKPLTRWDYLLALVLVVLSILVFDAAAIIPTASASFGYLNRQFLNFYEYAGECGIGETVYMPLVYLVYAVWNLPLKLTLLVRYPMPEVPYFALLWYKLLPLLLYVGCSYLVYCIAREIGMGQRKSKLCVLAAFTMPAGFFLQFSYGQVMALPLFFLLLGLLYYLRGSRRAYVGCFAAAIACQQYLWVLILPLLLLKEKRLRQLCENIFLAALPYALEYLIYHRSAGFLRNVRMYDLGKSFHAGLDNGIFVIEYVVFFWILLLGWAYFTRVRSKRELTAYALFFTGLAGTVTLCLTDWSPEYFLLLVPFSVLAAFLHRDIRIFLILDIGWAVLLVACVLLGRMESSGLDMAASLYTVLLLAIMAFKHPAFLAERTEELPCVYGGWLRARFLAGALLCLIPAIAVRLI